MDKPQHTMNLRQSLSRFLIYAVLILAAGYFLAPLYVMLSTSVKTMDAIRNGNLLALPDSLSFSAWTHAWSDACIGAACEGLRPYFFNSLQMVVPAVLISSLLGSLNGYIFSFWRFKGSEVLFTALMLGCFIPFQAVLLPMAQTLGWLGISHGPSRLVLVHVVYGLAFTTLFFRNFYVTIPDELIKAAKIDGAGFFRIYWRIILPLSVPIMVVCIIWQFTQIWNDFLFGVVFAGDQPPVTVALNNLVNTSTGIKEYNVDMAAAMIAALPTLLVYAVAGKYFVRGLTAGAVKG